MTLLTHGTDTNPSAVYGTIRTTDRAVGEGVSEWSDAVQWRRRVSEAYEKLLAWHDEPQRALHDARVVQRLRHIIEPGARVLDIGCGSGDLLAALQPSVGVGVDICSGAIQAARRRHPALRFLSLAGEKVHTLGDTFDYVLIADVAVETYDLHELLQSVARICHDRTRLVIVHDRPLWSLIRRGFRWLRAGISAPPRHGISTTHLAQLLRLSGFDVIRTTGVCATPIRIPWLSNVLDRVVTQLPILRHLSLQHVQVARCVHPDRHVEQPIQSVSIIVPARNEAGHIQLLLDRMPRVAERQEVIFVEGGSSDDTWAAIERAVRAYEGPFVLRCLQQSGKGKGDAVRAGFECATGDVLIILDADLGVPPEELSRVFETLRNGQAEFVNGARTLYPMQQGAMRPLNRIGNAVFAIAFTYLLSQRFHDTLCGTKALTRKAYDRIAENRSYFGDFDPFGDFDLLFGAARLNLKIVDIPLHYNARIYGETNISRFKDGWQLVRMCLLAARKLKFV